MSFFFSQKVSPYPKTQPFVSAQLRVCAVSFEFLLVTTVGPFAEHQVVGTSPENGTQMDVLLLSSRLWS